MREENFAEMFEALGDGPAQTLIRKTNEQKTHCFLLKRSAHACASLPHAIEGHEAGSPCPNNPFVRFADKILRQETTADLIQRAQDLHRSMKTGAFDEGTPSVEITLAYVYGEWLETRRAELWQKHSNF